MFMIELPVDPGSYALFLNLTSPQTLQIGRLGSGFFSPGNYVYFGSARGPGGLRSRLERHLRGDGKPHWHIDTLRAVAEVIGYCFITDDRIISHEIPIECLWSQAFANLPRTSCPLGGFGASDCRAGCPAHLIALSQDEDFELSRYGVLLADAIHAPSQAIIFQMNF